MPNPRAKVVWPTAVVIGLVVANASVVPVGYYLGLPWRICFAWEAQLGLAACWMTWGSGPVWLRYGGALLAIAVCAGAVHSKIAWENETLPKFLEFRLPEALVAHLVLLPTRWLGWRWSFPRGDGPQLRRFGIRELLLYAFLWAALLAACRWRYGIYASESVFITGVLACLTLAVVPVCWTILAERYWFIGLGGCVLYALVAALASALAGPVSPISTWLALDRVAVVAGAAAVNAILLRVVGLRATCGTGKLAACPTEVESACKSR